MASWFDRLNPIGRLAKYLASDWSKLLLLIYTSACYTGGQHELLETRCHLEFSDRQLTVTYIKKDEGFESDTESAKSVEPPSVVVADDEDEDKPVSGVEEKIIKDHVFRYSESGKDTEKDIKRQTFGFLQIFFFTAHRCLGFYYII